MFGFLKNKLKEWVDKAKEKLKPSEEIVEEKEEIKEEKPKEKKEAKKKGGKGGKTKKEPEVEEKPKKKKEKIILEEPIIKPEEAGTAIEIEKNLEEGVPEDLIEKEIEKKEEKFEEVKKEPEKIKEEPILEEVKEKPKVEEKEEIKEGFFKKFTKIFKKKEEIKEEPILEEVKEEKEEPKIDKKPKKEPETSVSEAKDKSFFQKLKAKFIYKITEEDFNSLFEDLEMLLLENNVALEVVEDLKKKLSERLVNKEIKKEDLEKVIKKELKNSLNDMLIDPDDPIDIIKIKKDLPFVILFFGINGTGKTTSIAKIAYALKKKGFSVVLAAADTFRAASIEQISEHAKNLEIPVIKQEYGADPAAVGFDAIKYAKSHNINVVLIDTAGRMHTKSNLISEMEKICRVTNPDLKIFVAESIAGNDATEQAKTFHESINIDGSILSKADIDEKGGTIISVSYATNKPIFYLGTGQKYEDLKLFNKQEFIESLGL